MGAGAEAATGADAGEGAGGLPHADFMGGFDAAPLPGGAVAADGANPWAKRQALP